ncbi:MAG: diaminopimelate decarboxylase [Clostridia bacterium]|nr:diaminopimelate decarboxylase [Clostridia bacterium]MCI2000300.1 diaminopimelate decarboxylase [Clostridia bacterium]MCI2015480.1 diaminopimelate decarboxylase [Clostridia bacterium]
MQKVYSKVTDSFNFFQGKNPIELAEKYGTPLYVYNERVIRQKCREIKKFVKYPKFVVDYSSKANTNIAFLQIVKSEGLEVDAVSPGEILAAKKAGFKPDEIFYISNNVSKDEMQYAIDAGVKISVDSLEQLEQYGQFNPGGEISVRFNPGVGAGHNIKVVTGGKKTKFGVNHEYVPQVKEILKKYNLKLIGINQHIGSLFIDDKAFVKSIGNLFDIARQFDDLTFIDMGGGFGVSYKKEEGQMGIDLEKLGKVMDEELSKFAKEYGKEIIFRIEPGRYVSAEAGVLLGTVHAVKYNGPDKFAGTDIGFNVLQRPVMYDSYHGIEIYRKSDVKSEKKELITVVGNVCESGDMLAKERMLPEIFKGDIIGVLDAGAYGYSMASNYNNRLRPAEVLIRENGDVVLIRERDTLDDLLRHQISL